MRKPIVAGNWKMNASAEFAQQISEQLNLAMPDLVGVEVVVSPPALYVSQVAAIAKGFSVAGQNTYFESSGAYTGEVSVEMLKDVGCQYVLVGHSERREIFAESDAQVLKKVAACSNQGLVPVLCVGETLAQRKAGKAFDVVAEQVLSVLTNLELTGEKIVIAYEPVWAIGTGETATPEQAQEMHAYIRNAVAEAVSADFADKVRILYGGSVNAKTAKELFAQQDIDGGLVGGASLKIEDFKMICSAAVNGN